MDIHSTFAEIFRDQEKNCRWQIERFPSAVFCFDLLSSIYEANYNRHKTVHRSVFSETRYVKQALFISKKHPLYLQNSIFDFFVIFLR